MNSFVVDSFAKGFLSKQPFVGECITSFFLGPLEVLLQKEFTFC